MGENDIGTKSSEKIDPLTDISKRLLPETLWSVYEANVQSYRSSSLSSQSIMLAVGAMLIDKPLPIFIGIAIIALIQIWPIWFLLINARIKIADFYKFDMEGKTYDGNRISLKKYITDKNLRKYFGIKTYRVTRFKLDILLPILITIVWLILIAYRVFFDC
jgi:hypothetical protein